MLQVLNKVDLISGKDLAAATAWLNEKNLANIVIPTSARDGKGVQDVRQWAASQLPKGPSLYPKVFSSSFFLLVYLNSVFRSP